MKRGDIYWVNLDPTVGSEIKKKRPCVIVTNDSIIKARSNITVVPISSQATIRPPIVIAVTCQGREVGAVCDQIRTIDKSRLTGFIETMSNQMIANIENGLRIVLSL